MTTVEVIERIKNALEDAGTFYTDVDIYDSLQDGYDEISIHTQCIEKYVTQSWTSGRPFVSIRTNVPDYLRVFAIFDNHQNSFLLPATLKELVSYDYKWQTREGNPKYFCPIGFDYVAFYPHYATAPSPLYGLFYIAIAPELTSSSTLQLPENATHVLVDYTTGDLLDQALEFKKSLMYNQNYQEGVQRIKREVNHRDMKDRIMHLIMNANLR